MKSIHHRRRIPGNLLAHSRVQIQITDLLARYELRHVFSNGTRESIEAVYSFPIPLDAAFMGMEADIAGEKRSAQVLPARTATRRYDDAISDGDSAVLLEQVEPGMLCVNLGNLKPGEKGEVILRFCAGLEVADGMARFSLPLVHRPRYGRSTLDELQVPQADFAAQHPLEAEIRVEGLLADCPVQCASPGVVFSRQEHVAVLQLSGAMLDRDLVLSFQNPSNLRSLAHRVEDGEASLGVVTALLPPSESIETPPRDICILLDGSGSMAGDAIKQSRSALNAVTDALVDGDRIQVIRFGSTRRALFRRPLKATSQVRNALHQLVDTVRADLGGTEMGCALEEALDQLEALDGKTTSKIVILVTDGAVTPHQIEKAQCRAIRSGTRVFVVAVGSSAGVDVLAPLALETGGRLERAVPAEPIDAGVLRQLRRARSIPVRVEIDWGGPVERELLPALAYLGDTVTCVARLPDAVSRRVALHVRSSEHVDEFVLAGPRADAAMRSWAGMLTYRHMEGDASLREQRALEYGLVVRETSAVLVKVRDADDRVDVLPTVTPVRHMVPAGMVLDDVVPIDDRSSAARACAAVPQRVSVPSGSAGRAAASYSMNRCDDPDIDAYLDMPAVLRRQPGEHRAPTDAPILPSGARNPLVVGLKSVLLGGIPGEVTREQLLDYIPDEFRHAVLAYLDYYCPGFSRRSLAELLVRLLERSLEPELTDSDEVTLALMRTTCGNV